MMKLLRIWSGVLFVMVLSNLSAQKPESYFLNALRVNSSFSYVPDSDDENHRYSEITWSNQFSVSLTDALWAGVQVSSVYTSGTDVPSENFFLMGGFLQYDVLKKEKAMGFIEVNYLQGDYCTCGLEDPFRKSGLHYLGVGIGLDYPLFDSRFYGSASFIVHRILGDVERKYGYNIPKVGLTYRFGKSKIA